MPEALKKISRKIQGKPEPEILIGNEPFFADLKHTETQVRRNFKPIEETTPIVCPSCKKEITATEVKKIVRSHGVTSKALLVNKKGEQNHKLAELYAKIKKKRIKSAEAFETQERILNMYSDRYVFPSEEQPISHVSGRVNLECPKCDYPLGSVDVTITAKPETVIAPDVDTWIALEKISKEVRILKEYLLPKGITYDDWLTGKNTLPFIEKLEGYKKELETMPFIRELERPMSNVFSAINLAIQKIQDEVLTRPSRVFNLLKNPPKTPVQKIEED